MAVYYNEFDPYAAEWIRELIREGLVPDGEVDERSIKDVQAVDLRGFVQCHFFCGIAGWSAALRLAGWDERRPVWTGSCPCQPYSAAGKQKGNADARDLWPDFYRLIRECKPPTVFGEQVSSAIRFGWIDRVRTDLEAEGYAVGFAVLGAHSVGAPHIRQRLYWVAHAECAQRRPHGELHNEARGRQQEAIELRGSGDTGEPASPLARGLANATGERGCGWEETRDGGHSEPRRPSSHGWLADADGPESGRGELRLHQISRGRDGFEGIEERSAPSGVEHATSDGREQGRTGANRGSVASGCGVDGVGNTISNDSGRDGGNGFGTEAEGQGEREELGDLHHHPIAPSGVVGSFWRDSRVILCRDGKSRRIPSQSSFQFVADGLPTDVDDLRIACEDRFPLAKGVPKRAVLLRGAGNAICVPTAAAFIRAFLEVEGEVT